MADAQILYDEDVAATVATDTNWVTTALIPAASFTAGKRYLILASCAAELASATGETRMRLVHGTTPTVFPDAAYAHETLAATNTSAHQMGWLYDFTQPGTTEDVFIQLSSSSTADATNRLSQILAIKLDDDFVSGTDFLFAEDTADYTMTATPTAKATTASFTPNGTDRWLFIGNMIYDGVSVVDEVGFELYDSVGGVLGMCQREVEDATNDFLGHNIFWSGVPTNAARTLAVRPFNEAGSNVMLSSRVFAINLSKFAQSASAFTAAELDLGTNTNLQTVSITPNTTGDFVYIAYACFDMNNTGDDIETRVQVDDGGGLANSPAYTATNTPGIDSVDALDESGFSVFNLRSLTSGASRTINYDATRVAGTTSRAEDRGIVVFSKALAGASPTTFTPAPVALTLTNPAPTVPLALSLAPAPVAATSAVPAPSVQLALNLAPAPVVTTPTVPAPSLPLALNLAPDPVAIVSAVPNSVLDAPTPTTFTPDPVALLLAEPAPTLGLTLTLAPAPVPIVLTDPAPTLGGELLLSPDPVAVTPAVPAPSLPLALTLAPAPVGVTPVVPAPSMPSSLSLTPDPVPIVLSVPEPSFGSGGDTVFTPDPVVLLLSVPGPTFEAAEPSRIKTRVAMTTEESAPGVPLWGANTVTTDLVPGQNDIAIENLVAGLTYYVKVWNEDTFGNRSSERTQVIRSETPKRLVPLTFSANGVLDQTSPMYIFLKVPAEVTEVQSAKVTFAFREFVANATAATAVSDQTSNSGGGSTSGASSTSSSANGNGSGTMSAEPDHTHSHGDPVTGGGGDHGHTFTPDPHAHNIEHTHSTPNHQHTVPGHGHGLTYGTFEETYPVSHSCVLRIYKRVGGSWGSPVYTQSGITADLWDKSLLGIISGPGDWRISIQSSGGTPQGGRLGCDVFGVLNVVM